VSRASQDGPLLASLGTVALRVGDRTLGADAVVDAVGGVAAALTGLHRVAVWATPTLDTCVGVAGAIAAGVPVVPLDPRAAPAELVHLVEDSHPQAVLAANSDVLPSPVGGLPRVSPLDVTPAAPPVEPADPEATALVIYTSGTTGLPKGAALSRRAVAACLDGLADAWAWTAADVLVHGLPLFHVHGLVLGVLGPLRVGGGLHHVGRFSPDGVTRAVEAGGTVVFGVPTMWSRIAAAPSAGSLRRARLLVSGSAGLPRPVYDALVSATGQGPVERYGMTETLIVAAARSDEPRVPGSVGGPLTGVSLRLDDVEDGIGELAVRGPTLFSGYLHRPAGDRPREDRWASGRSR
jgi:acyl-CoA synthetase (AMP-forming)/AMP-acid ligase II